MPGGGQRKLGHEEKRNKERSSGKGAIDFVILLPLWPSTLDIFIHAACCLFFIFTACKEL